MIGWFCRAQAICAARGLGQYFSTTGSLLLARGEEFLVAVYMSVPLFVIRPRGIQDLPDEGGLYGKSECMDSDAVSEVDT